MSIARGKQTSPVFWKLLRVLVFNNLFMGQPKYVAIHWTWSCLDLKTISSWTVQLVLGFQITMLLIFSSCWTKQKTQNKSTNRNFRTIDTANFQKELKLKFNNIIAGVDYIDCLTEAFEECTINSLDHFAPVSMKTRKTRIRQPWYNSNIHEARRIRRKCEKKWRKTRLEVHHQLYIEQNRTVNCRIEEAKKQHISEKLQSASDTKTVFKIVNGLLNNTSKVLPAYECAQDLSNDFVVYCQEKVANIYSSMKHVQSSVTGGNSHNVCVACKLPEFSQACQVSEEDVIKLVNKAATKSCILDPVPTWFLKDNVSIFLPVLTRIINKSLTTGIFPSILKHTVLNPLIKKRSLNTDELKNYRPVANIKFLSKLIEKHVVNNINDHIVKNGLGEEFQSAYCVSHSTETALLKVKSDIMGMIHNEKGVFLVLLDLSAAFDTGNHNVLFNRLECEIGITGTALEWFKSNFSGRTTQVLIDNTYSASHDMLYGLPQGSIVGPKSFTIYTIPIGRIIKGNNLLYHIYADDIQIYTSFTPSDSSSIQSALQALTKCIVELKSWMTENMLKLNNNKTEFFVATSPHFNRLMPSVQLHIGDEIITPTKTVRNLGIVFDNLMSMSSQITSLSSSVSYHLRNITRIRRFLDVDTCSSVTRYLVLSRLDYANALLLGANTTQINRLQHLQNWAAKLIFCASKHDHATPFLKKLHWLLVKERIQFKILVHVYKYFNGLAPAYLSSCFSFHIQTRAGLRSASDKTRLAENKPSSKSLQSAASKSFSLAAPGLWNHLPITIRTSISLPIFKKALKKHLFP